MKRVLSFSLCFLYVFSLHLPIAEAKTTAGMAFLAEHFLQHQKENPNTSVFSFLVQHYGKDCKKHAKQHNHSKLPVKVNHNCSGVCSSAEPALLTQVWHFDAPHDYPTSNLVKLPTTDEFLIACPCSDIWQPPKL